MAIGLIRFPLKPSSQLRRTRRHRNCDRDCNLKSVNQCDVNTTQVLLPRGIRECIEISPKVVTNISSPTWKTHQETPRSHRNRQRNVTWVNPLYSKNLKTEEGSYFLSLINQHLPKSNPLYKIFNRNTLKLRYSCMSNVKTIISNHDKAEINKPSKSPDEAKCACNCRDKILAPWMVIDHLKKNN